MRYCWLWLIFFFNFTQNLKAQQSSSNHMQSTAGTRVRVIDTAFFMPQLSRHRRVWVYLPEGYEQSSKRFPVLYLQDGQNIFDRATSFSGEWGVDEALDSLGTQFEQCLVVAVDNGGDKRMSEYSPFDFTLTHGDQKIEIKGEAGAYADFLVHTLRPFLIKNFKASRSRKRHFIAGSSMGGLLAFYAVLKDPKKWGGAGVFSPAFWVVKKPLLQEVTRKGRSIKCPIYFYAGNEESADMVSDMLAVLQALNTVSKTKAQSIIRGEGKHSESDWQREFPLFYEWMMQQ